VGWRNSAGAGGAEGDNVDHQRFLPIDAARAERLLSGPLTDSDPVSRLLAAAAAPARPEEVAGEAAAVMAFHGARRAAQPAAPLTRRHHRKGRSLVAIAAGIGLAVAAAGIALAAGTGVLPNPWINVDSPDTHTPTTIVTGGSSTNGQTSSSAATHSGGASTPVTSSTPTPGSFEDLLGLCNSYLNRSDRDPGKSMDSGAVERLAAAAGGQDKITGFCTALLAAQPTPTGTASGTGTASPTG
jgi:hypothetical protein